MVRFSVAIKFTAMPVKRKPVLPSRRELHILQALWELGEATVEDVVQHPISSPTPNYKTTQTLLRIMESKGLVRHFSRGRVFVFLPQVTREQVGRLSVQTLLKQTFSGSPAELVVNLLAATSIDESELEELESLIRNYREQKKNDSK